MILANGERLLDENANRLSCPVNCPTEKMCISVSRYQHLENQKCFRVFIQVLTIITALKVIENYTL